MTDKYQLTLNDYLDILKRRWLYLLAPFVIIFLLSVIIAIKLPPVYSSSGTILIESQQIPTELVRSTVTSYADERIQVIKQRVMTRENLLRIIEKFNLFHENRDKLTVSEQIELMRANIKVTKVVGGLVNKRNKNLKTIAFKIGYEDKEPELAQVVANEIVTLFLDENIKARTSRASETTEFLTQEAKKLKQGLETIEEQIAGYKQEHGDALPEHLDLHMKMLERAESNIKDIQRNIKSAQNETRFLEIELSAARAGVVSRGNVKVVLTPAQELAAAENELAALEIKYSQNHPDVKRLLSQIEALREIVVQPETENDSADSPDIVETMQNIDEARVQAKILTVNERINSLKLQGKRLDERRKELEAIIIQTPQVQRALVSLNRDYENTLKKYKEIQGKEMEAKLAESLESSKKAERFTLIEPPLKPELPIKPNRKKIMAMGFFLALAASGGLVMLLESSDGRIRGSLALTALLKERLLVSVPYIKTEAEVRRRKRLIIWLLTGAVVSVIGLLVAVHFLYMPLDLLILKIQVRLG